MEKIVDGISKNIVNSKVWFKNGFLLAPMVRLGTTPFRLLALRHGADVVFTEEIISFKLANCVRVENEKLKTVDFILQKDKSVVLRIAPEEKGKLILQIGANDPEIALKAAEIVKNDVIGVDVNMGCPKHFSTHGNMGSNLIYCPDLACSILTNLRKNLDILVSCKIRIHENIEETLKFIAAIQETGIDFYTVHYRTKFQDAKTKANWSIIPEIYKNSKIPVFANGDIFTPEDYFKLKPFCDGVMLARGAVHNPEIFELIKNQINKNNEISINTNPNISYNNSIDSLMLKEENDIDKSKTNILNLQDKLINDYEELDQPKDKELKLSSDICEVKNNNQKEKSNSVYDDNVKESKNLAKIFQRKYKGNKINILPVVKEFIELAEKYENPFHNTKYNSSYILKTHKKEMSYFNAIQKSKTYDDLNKIFSEISHN